MGFSCERFPKVCQSCAAQKSLSPTLPANSEATILKEGERSGAWQLTRQRPGSGSSRARAACSDSEADRGVLAKDLAGPDIAPQCHLAPQRRNGLVARLAHDDELPHAVHRGLGHSACPERVAAELLDHQACPAGCTLEELADRIFVATGAPRRMPRPAMFQETVSAASMALQARQSTTLCILQSKSTSMPGPSAAGIASSEAHSRWHDLADVRSTLCSKT